MIFCRKWRDSGRLLAIFSVMAQQSLYDRVGGETTVQSLVADFYDRIQGDEKLAPFFAKSDMQRQRSMFREFISAALDGPAQYTGRSIAEAHQGRGIGSAQIQRFVDHLLDAVRAFEIETRDVDEIIARINTYADEVTGGGAFNG